jgi:hypothetical protein
MKGMCGNLLTIILSRVHAGTLTIANAQAGIAPGECAADSAQDVVQRSGQDGDQGIDRRLHGRVGEAETVPRGRRQDAGSAEAGFETC